MKFIVDNKIYDTDKAELLCTFSKQWRYETAILGVIYPYRDTNLYRTAKGSYFLTCSADYDKCEIEVIDEKTAKNWLMYKAYDKYAEMFGPLEEA